MPVNGWTYTRTIGGIAIRNASGLIATVHQEPYAPQIAATPDLYEALDELTDITVCVPGSGSQCGPEWFADLERATSKALDALEKARGER